MSSQLGSDHTITCLARNVITTGWSSALHGALCPNATWQNMFVIFSIAVMDHLHRLILCTSQGVCVKAASEITRLLSCRQNAENEDKISATPEWSRKEVCFRQQLTCLSRKTDSEWQELWFDFSTSQEWLASLGGLSIWRKQTPRIGRLYLSNGQRFSSSSLPPQLWLMSSHSFPSPLPNVSLTSHSLSVAALPLSLQVSVLFYFIFSLQLHRAH